MRAKDWPVRARATRGPVEEEEEGEKEGEVRERVRMGRSGVRVALGGGEVMLVLALALLNVSMESAIWEKGEGRGEDASLPGYSPQLASTCRAPLSSSSRLSFLNR